MLIGTLEQIASFTSVEIAERLARTYGGTRLYIPKNPTENHPLVHLIGMDNVHKIIDNIGHGDFVLPAGEYRGSGAKASFIRKLLTKGYSTREIALMADCCERTVWRHKQKQALAFASRQCRLPF